MRSEEDTTVRAGTLLTMGLGVPLLLENSLPSSKTNQFNLKSASGSFIYLYLKFDQHNYSWIIRLKLRQSHNWGRFIFHINHRLLLLSSLDLPTAPSPPCGWCLPVWWRLNMLPLLGMAPVSPVSVGFHLALDKRQLNEFVKNWHSFKMKSCWGF